MTPALPPANENSGHNELHQRQALAQDFTKDIDLREMFARISRGLASTLGLAFLGMAAACALYLAVSPFNTTSTSMRISFAFNGYAKEEYPDHSRFEPDDFRAPDIIADALRKRGLENIEGLQGTVRSAITIEGIIPPNVIKERDRIRSTGQILPPYLPDEYIVTLTLPIKGPLSGRDRELLLNEIVSSFQEKFHRTYTDVPAALGNAFESLRDVDFPEYELVLNTEIENTRDFLKQQLGQAKTFRSPTTNLSFDDLLTQTDLFARIRLDGILGLIRQNGLSLDRSMALVKMDYYLRTLQDQEQKAIEEEKVVDDLLSKAQDRSGSYVLGIKSQAAQQRSEPTVLDQGLIDSLLANDSSNFLVRQALTAGLKVKAIQAERLQILERRKELEVFKNQVSEDQSGLITHVQRSLKDLEKSYNDLISNIRKTQADFSRQQYSAAIRISMPPKTVSKYRALVIDCVIGAFIGLALGIGTSLIGICIGPKRSVE